MIVGGILIQLTVIVILRHLRCQAVTKREGEGENTSHTDITNPQHNQRNIAIKGQEGGTKRRNGVDIIGSHLKVQQTSTIHKGTVNWRNSEGEDRLGSRGRANEQDKY